MNAELTAITSLSLVLFVAVLAILWILLPLAVFGIKRQLKELIDLERRQLENLRMLRRALARLDDDGLPIAEPELPVEDDLEQPNGPGAGRRMTT